MKQDTLEEKIVDDFGNQAMMHGFSFKIAGEAPSYILHHVSGDHIEAWLRTTLTSYRNDVLEEVLEGMPTKIFIDPILGRRSIYNDGWNECIDKIRHLIKSLKVDI